MRAETILKMIEAVDPKDTKAMDKIDWLVDRYVNPDWQEIVGTYGQPRLYKWEDGSHERQAHEYTRSRDALKAIRPDGYALVIGKIWPDYFTIARIFHVKDPVAFETKEMKTEELAELHAVIQAIAYERTQTPEGK